MVLVITFAIPSISIGQETDEDALKLMSFNIRNGMAEDGEDHWDKRKPLVVQTIANYAPSIVGLQESWDFQSDYLVKQLPNYTYVGRARQRSGKGEHVGVLYQTERFDKVVEGYFWLSLTPDRAGSKSWDSSITRMVTWLKFWDRETKKTLYVINTHFDHRGRVARNKSAELIREFIAWLPKDSNIILLGDFNAAEKSTPYNNLFGIDKNDVESPIVDTYRFIRPESVEAEGTFGGFIGRQKGPRIDWIGASRNLIIKSAKIDRSEFGGRFPSDHYPVTALIEYPAKSKVGEKKLNVTPEPSKTSPKDGN